MKWALEEKAVTLCFPLLVIHELCHEGAVALAVYLTDFLSPFSAVTCECPFPG